MTLRLGARPVASASARFSASPRACTASSRAAASASASAACRSFSANLSASQARRDADARVRARGRAAVLLLRRRRRARLALARQRRAHAVAVALRVARSALRLLEIPPRPFQLARRVPRRRELGAAVIQLASHPPTAATPRRRRGSPRPRTRAASLRAEARRRNSPRRRRGAEGGVARDSTRRAHPAPPRHRLARRAVVRRAEPPRRRREPPRRVARAFTPRHARNADVRRDLPRRAGASRHDPPRAGRVRRLRAPARERAPEVAERVPPAHPLRPALFATRLARHARAQRYSQSLASLSLMSAFRGDLDGAARDASRRRVAYSFASCRRDLRRVRENPRRERREALGARERGGPSKPPRRARTTRREAWSRATRARTPATRRRSRRSRRTMEGSRAVRTPGRWCARERGRGRGRGGEGGGEEPAGEAAAAEEAAPIATEPPPPPPRSFSTGRGVLGRGGARGEVLADAVVHLAFVRRRWKGRGCDPEG